MRNKHAILSAVVIGVASLAVSAAEFKMYDGSRLAALVDGFDGKGNLIVFMSSGERKDIPLRDISTIFYTGRTPRFIRTGEQRFLFNTGGGICGEVDGLAGGETVRVKSQSLGEHAIPLKFFHGVVAMSIQGRAGRMAEDMVSEEIPTEAEIKAASKDDKIRLARRRASMTFLDQILDRKGLAYVGVLEDFTDKNLVFEHDEHTQMVAIETFKISGIRLAEAEKERAGEADWTSADLRVGVECRDGSYMIGQLAIVDPFQWVLKPIWDPQREFAIPTNEITRVDVLGGRAVYLAQLKPIVVEEKTILAPPQPYRNNTNSQNESLDIGGFIYHNGIGVHARSLLTYKLGGGFSSFRADVGIDGRLEKNGTVVFVVKGDGKELFRSPLVRGKPSGGGLPIEVSVQGVKELTLLVEPTDDLDQADCANWGGVRVLR